jgi:DNA (cytosine-5)-methyltransferase 1
MSSAPNRTLDVLDVADLFCGGGGTTTGLKAAAESLGLTVNLHAVNHWEIAVASYQANHAGAASYCHEVGKIDPLQVVPSGRLELLVASPECTHHSNARGGKPRDDQKRADAWELFAWLTKIYTKNVLIENVREFRDWGPLGADGKPLKSGKGKYYKQFRDWLEVTYKVEERILNAANYGDATTRERLFLICRRPKNKTIYWPVETHASRKEIESAKKQPSLFNIVTDLRPWRAAREIIDWSLPSYSIWLTKEDVKRCGLKIKRPLSPNTTARVYSGFDKHSGLSFVLPNEGFFRGNAPRSTEEPLPTVTSRGAGALVEPFLLNLKGTDRRDRSVDEPTFTQTGARAQYLVEGSLGSLAPYLFNMEHNNGVAKHETYCYDVDRPLTTVAGKGMFGLIQPFLVQLFGERDGQEPRTRTVDEPLWTVTGQNRAGVCESWLVKLYGGHDAASLNDPLGTVCANYEHYGLAEPFLTTYHGSHKGRQDGNGRVRSLDEPLPTADGSNRFGLSLPYIVPVNHGSGDSRSRSVEEPLSTITSVDALGLAHAEPYLVKFFGTSDGQSINEPLGTVVSRDKYGLAIPQVALVIPQLGIMLDIRFRMLQPHELAAAMSFPRSYKFTGTREDKVKQIGNAVPIELSKALCKSILSETGNVFSISARRQKRVGRVSTRQARKAA